MWQELSHNDGNGIITEYIVCYQVSNPSTKNVSCTKSETVKGKTTTDLLNWVKRGYYLRCCCKGFNC